MSKPIPRNTVGQTLFVAVCDLEPGRVQSLLPAPLTAAGEQAFIYIVWCSINVPSRPLRARTFLEANVALPCQGPAGEGTWFVRAFFPSHDLVQHAHLSGWRGMHAEIQVGRVPSGCRQFLWPPEHPVGGWVAREGRREIELVLTVGEPVDIGSTPLRKFASVYGVRTLGERPDVTLEKHYADVMHRVHRGTADLKLSGETAELLGPVRVASGYLVEFGVDYGGSEVVPG